LGSKLGIYFGYLVSAGCVCSTGGAAWGAGSTLHGRHLAPLVDRREQESLTMKTRLTAFAELSMP
jgi:hypothetical protein